MSDGVESSKVNQESGPVDEEVKSKQSKRGSAQPKCSHGSRDTCSTIVETTSQTIARRPTR